MTRLPYETSGGNLSAEITFKQLIEYLVLLTEDCHALGNLSQDPLSRGWHTIANNFDKTATVVTHLAKGKTGSSVGFTHD